MTTREARGGRRVAKLATLTFAVTAILGASACLPGTGDSGNDENRQKKSGAGRAMTFDLAAESVEPVKINVPAKPVAVAKTSTEGMRFELYALERSDKVVNVVFAMHNSSDETIKSLKANKHLDENPGGVGYQASAVSLLDPKGLKEYRSYLAGNEDDPQCLCSDVYTVGDPNDFSPDERQYYMTQVAAPPTSVTEVTVLANVASLPGQKIEG